jgi:uncharacterized protein (DUF305 family)
MNRTMRIVALPVALSGVLTVSACGSNGQPGHDMATHNATTSATTAATASANGTAAAGVHNAADIEFDTGMIPHHGQALTMADMALTRATNQQVTDLAAQIKKTQDPEIQQMSGWLKGWGEPVPEAQGMHHGDGVMSMMEMDSLGKAEGAKFDRMWLAMMIQHHEGAITMARIELNNGANAEAKALAQAIIDQQSTEITTMNILLAQLGG